jgi:hypothetical protein
LNLLPTYKETGVLPRYIECEIVDSYEVFTDPITGKKSRPGYMLRFSTRDSKLLNEILNRVDGKISSRKSKRITNILCDGNNNWLLSKIDEKKTVEVSCPVYNIEVDNDNSYIAEGVVVHNCEHVQIPELSKGKVIDAVLREVPIGKDNDGRELTTYYVDILIATDRKHVDLVRKIESGETDKMSMGCTIAFSRCSKCGNIAKDETEACQHVKYEKNNTFYDNNGVQRKVAELCGAHDQPESVTFVDASWVANPAFVGAVKRNNIYPSSDIMAKIESAFKKEGYKVKEGDYLKAAAMLILSHADKDAADPKEEEPVDEPAKDSEPPSGAPDEVADSAPTDAAPEEQPPMDAPPEDPGQNDIKKWKSQIKQQVLKQIGDEIADDFSNEDESANELETLDESIIKPASSMTASEWKLFKDICTDLSKMLKKGSINRKDCGKMRSGSYMVLASKDFSILSNYGYGKRDILAVLSCIDRRALKPLSLDIKREISKMAGSNGSKPTKILSSVVASIGRKISMDEGRKALMWVKILDGYDS